MLSKVRLSINNFRTNYFKPFTIKSAFLMLGSLLIFGSWIVEHHQQADWTAEKEKLKRSQLIIDIDETQRSIYENAINIELQKREKDSLLLAVNEQKLTECYLAMLIHQVERVGLDKPTYDSLMLMRKNFDKSRATLLNGHLYHVIDLTTSQVTQLFNSKYLVWDKQFINKVGAVDAKESRWSDTFFWSYITGSISLAISFLLKERV